MTRPDVLYVKLKKDSPFTVSRSRIDSMAEFFQQDATLVTHFALARLSDEIAQGKLSRASDLPMASNFLTPEQVGQLRLHAQNRLSASQVNWEANPELDVVHQGCCRVSSPLQERKKMAMKLYSFFRSGTSYRLRIALNLKGLATDYVAVDLRTEAHLQQAFKAINPQGLVPALDTGEQVLIQSPAIIEWLEEKYPTPALLPQDVNARAQVRALAAIVGCDMHPVNNRRILEYLRQHFGAHEDTINAWCGTWIGAGFDAYEALLAADKSRGAFSVGDTPSLADVYLIPQIESARRFKVDLTRWPLIAAVEAACLALDPFKNAAPLKQPDAG